MSSKKSKWIPSGGKYYISLWGIEILTILGLLVVAFISMPAPQPASVPVATIEDVNDGYEERLKRFAEAEEGFLRESKKFENNTYTINR